MDKELSESNRFGYCKCGCRLMPVYNLEEQVGKDMETHYFREVSELSCPNCLRNEIVDTSFDVEISKSTYDRILLHSSHLHAEPFRVIVAGSRTFNDYQVLCNRLDKCLSRKIAQHVDIEIVSGRARGADKLGERYAEEHGLDLVYMPADWKIGRRAGYIRNQRMAAYADALVAFWDGSSPGTKHMIELARKQGLDVRVYC